MAPESCAGRYVRKVGGRVLSSVVVCTTVGRIELYRRQCLSRFEWHFCQPETTLFWHGEGFKSMRGTVDGNKIDCRFVGKSRLSIFPAETVIKTEFDLHEFCDYAVMFFDPGFLESRVVTKIARTRIAFSNDVLLAGLAQLCREAETGDNLFELFAEGWAMQALAQVSRIAGQSGDILRPPFKGGLALRIMNRLQGFIRDHLADAMTLDQLAEMAGLSKRHFLRAFAESVGVTPHRYILSLRIEEAKRHLLTTGRPVTDIALDCGFSHAQHFSSSFRRMTGFTPSEFRQRAH